MLREIKNVIESYLNSKQLTDFVTGQYTEAGLKITDQFTIPKKLIHVPRLLQNVVKEGDRILCLRGFSGKLYVVLDVME